MAPSDVVRFVTKLVLHNDEAIFTQTRALHDIDVDLKASEARIAAMLAEVAE